MINGFENKFKWQDRAVCALKYCYTLYLNCIVASKIKIKL